MHQQQTIEREFVERIQQHQSILHKIGFVFAKTADERDDLRQEIILQLWKSYPSFKGNSKFSTWMYRVALNTAITVSKKTFLPADPSMNYPGSNEFEKSMDYQEDVKILYKAISHLNKVEKAIVLLWLEETSYDKISEAVGISVKNVSVKLVRIKAKLATLIKKYQ